MRKISVCLFLIFFSACSSNKKKQEGILPSEQKTVSSLSKDYPGLFSAADSYIHLPIEEIERDDIVSQCKGGKSEEIIRRLFTNMKDESKVHINNYYIALCYSMNKDLTRGLHYFEKVVSQSTDLYLKSKAQMNMAVIQWNWNKSRKALINAREAYNIRQTPVNLYLLTTFELNLGLYQKVATRIPEMLKYKYSDNNWRFLLAQSSFYTSDYDQAVQHFGLLSADFWENNIDALSHYTVALYKTGRNQALKNLIKQWKTKLQNNKHYIIVKNLYPEIIKYE